MSVDGVGVEEAYCHELVREFFTLICLRSIWQDA